MSETDDFFKRPILNSPYAYPARHWELDDLGQPTHHIIENRRKSEFKSPIPKPRKQKGKARQTELDLVSDDQLSSSSQNYETSGIITELRFEVDKWRKRPNPADWQVTPETARLLQHWRNHPFTGVRPFFCQVEAVETAIWLTEVAPHAGKSGARFLDHLANANHEANPDLMRLALKLATGAGIMPPAGLCRIGSHHPSKTGLRGSSIRHNPEPRAAIIGSHESTAYQL